ncbi:MAG: sugar phosphate nucleotidyltransferase [Oceanococcus sp.]
MKVVILAGGRGERLVEPNCSVPKPLVNLDDQPILRHVMNIYAQQGFDDFTIALGHRADAIRDYFAESPSDHCNIELVDTGQQSDTGGRIGRLREHLADQPFMLTWADGVANIKLSELLAKHRQSGCLVTLTAVHPPARFGELELQGDLVAQFQEKPKAVSSWINGAFFVVEPKIFDYIDGDDCSWERDVLPLLAQQGQLAAYRHDHFWQCMDTPFDRRFLQRLCATGTPPWQILEST